MNRFCIYILVPLLLVFSNGAIAGNKTATPEDRARKAIDACWAISKEDRSRDNVSMQNGIIDTTLCMDDHIMELAEKYLFPDSPKEVKETKQNLQEIRNVYQRLYWNLFNSLDACYQEPSGPMCGTENHTVHAIAHAQLLEGIIPDCYKQVERYDITPKD